MGAIFTFLPLMAIPVIVYNLVALVFVDRTDATGQAIVGAVVARLQEPLVSVPMVSGAQWTVSAGDGLILLGLALLFVEIIKATNTRTASIMNHAISMGLFVFCLIQFLLYESFGTSVYFIITVMALLDVLAGVIITIMAARRDISVSEGFGDR